MRRLCILTWIVAFVVVACDTPAMTSSRPTATPDLDATVEARVQQRPTEDIIKTPTPQLQEAEAIVVVQSELRRSLSNCQSLSQRDELGLLQGPDGACSEDQVLKAFGASRAMQGLRVPFLSASVKTLLEHGEWTAVYEPRSRNWKVEGRFHEVPGRVWVFYVYEATALVEGEAPSVLVLPLEQLSPEDVARRFSSEPSVSPMFRQMVERRALQQPFPFALQQATRQEPENVFDPGPLSVSEFEGFLREVMGDELPSIRQQLRTAADFLRSPDWDGGVLSPQQDFIRRMLEEEGEVGSARFRPTFELLSQTGGQRGSFDLWQSMRHVLEDMLASDPLRFQTLVEFLDYLAAQGVI